MFAVGLAVLVLGLAAVAFRNRDRGWRPSANDGYAVAALAFAAELFLINPDATLSSGGPGGLVSERASLLLVYAAVLWLAAHSLPRRLVRAAVVGCLVVAGGLFAVRLPWYLRLSDHAAAFELAASCVARHSTFAQTNLARVDVPSRRTDPITNEAARIAALTEGWDLLNTEPITRIFPYRSRPEVDPYPLLRGPGGWPETINPVIDPVDYARTSGATVDYILVFGRRHATEAIIQSPHWQQLDAELAASYRLVGTLDDGWLELHERADADLTSRGDAIRSREHCQAVADKTPLPD